MITFTKSKGKVLIESPCGVAIINPHFHDIDCDYSGVEIYRMPSEELVIPKFKPSEVDWNACDPTPFYYPVDNLDAFHFLIENFFND